MRHLTESCLHCLYSKVLQVPITKNKFENAIFIIDYIFVFNSSLRDTYENKVWSSDEGLKKARCTGSVSKLLYVHLITFPVELCTEFVQSGINNLLRPFMFACRGTVSPILSKVRCSISAQDQKKNKVNYFN